MEQGTAEKPGAESPSVDSKQSTPKVDANGAPQREPKFQDYVRLFHYANNWDFLAYAAGTAAAIGSGITIPLLNIVFGKFATKFSAYAGTQTLEKGQFQGELNQLSLYMLGLFLGRFVLSYINQLAFRMTGIRISSALRQDFLTALFSQSVHVLDSMPPGYATTVITTASNTVQLGISEKLGVFFEYNATMIASIIIAFVYSWQLSLVTFTAVVFIVLSVSILLPPITKGQARQGQSDAKSASIASEALSSLKMVVACCAEGRIGTKYGRFVDEAGKHAQSIGPLISVQFGLIFFSSYAAFGLAFWYGTKLLVEHKINELGAIIVVLFSVMMIVASMERTSTPLLAVGKAMIAACEFFTVIDAPRPDPGHLRDPDVSPTEDLVFENVTFAYPSRPHVKILDNFNLTIEKGKVTALVGPSGSGKSTIVGLVERWYSLNSQHVISKTIDKTKKDSEGEKNNKDGQAPQQSSEEEDDTGPPIELQGTVSTCGHSLDDINLKWWRSQIGLVQQEPFLFNDTIYKNVANGLVGTKWENEAEQKKKDMVRDACKEAFADEFIEKLTEGYDTPVGEGGAKLSGGQRQRIAIARAIIRQPSILILDEATSAIDVRGEKIVQAALDKASKNRTTITIAHRLSTIKKADRIVVLRQGKVVESGTHESLLEDENGLYHSLVHAQALSMEEAMEPKHAETREEPTSLVREKSGAESAKAENIFKKKYKTKSIFSSFGRFFYETRSNWWMMALALVFSACAGAAIPFQSWLFAKVILVFSYFPDTSKVRQESEFWSLMWTVLAIAAGISYFATFFFSNRTASTIRAKYQKQYFSSILYQQLSFFDDDDHSQGTMTARSSSDPRQLEELLGTNMASVFIAIWTLTGTIAIAFAFAWKLALVSFCVVVPILLGTGYWRLRYELQFDEMNTAVFADSSKFASEAIGAFRTVVSLTLEDSICDRFSKLARGHVTDAYKKARWVTVLFAFSDSATIGCQALVLYYGGRLLLNGEFSLQSFFVCFISILNAGETTGRALSFGPNVAQVSGAANRILSLRASQVKDDPAATGELFKSDGDGLKIELDNITFKYPTRDVPVFKGLSLTIEKGQFAALVGASGCGKSSIISLLERQVSLNCFYDLDGGRILCNGQDIAANNVYAYRSHLSLVAQESSLMQGTLRENILLGVEETTVTDEMIHDVCRQASIHDFIVSLPEGYNTDIGSRGVSLSGGQRQRVAIARALIRNPGILLLDEATSALDSESEKQVQAAFELAGKGRTMLAVAHRLATVQNADVIFVLGEGKLLEKGNHQELLANRGVYWQMCQSQALDR
ncbi:ABC transporter, transmembrane domain, type 1 [Cordyceps fumosorosea ARSEF 2679]|uniref:ABC transporter, transmembrane domain, type 1 n=1 Tax=Cordyceps fumosorosea (strain ARSEF 2679) TaxID=1081104 RepID=A0A168E1P0_CORFA|nr:ABC transporter, transmembrane domain, type 1 [Cordyceps fumosorosea ARSEF 2679]OAA73276.1 ABC transporter, transmembrane domain, type 1 [Cordyceps fumosorosea ARSEF 2679]